MHKILSASAAAGMLVTVVPATAASAAEPAASAIVGVKVSTTRDARLTVSGRLTAVDGTPVAAGKSLIIENAPANRAKWYRMPLGKKEKPIRLVTREGGYFSGTYYAGFAHGWYRIRFEGGPILKPSVSPQVRDRRINALTTKWKVTPRKIRKGGYVTFTGVLTHDPADRYVPFAGQRVYVQGRIKGQKKWYWYARPKTNSKGYFKARFKVTKDTYFEWYYAGDATHYWDFPLKSTFVDVR